ncbi:MAG: lysylphosphatidylglycerol synthase transmembrane domain-containing protein [Geminicoccaceae bacterium]
MVGKLGGALALSLVLWFSVDWTAALAVLAESGRWLILAAFLASVANILISAGKWQILLRRSRVELGYVAAAQLYWIGAFFSNFLPTGVGGDAVRLMMTPSDHGRAPVATSILVERLSGFAVMLGISAVALATLPLHLGSSRALGVLVVAALTAVVLSVLYLPGWFLALLLLVERTLPRLLRRPFAHVHRLTAGLFGPGSDPRSVTQALIWSVPFYGAMMLAQYFMLRAVGADPGALAVILGAPLISLVSMTPVTINGLFLAEGAFVLVYASAGVPAEVALAAAIVRRLVDLANSGLGSGMWLAWQLGLRGTAWPGRGDEHDAAAVATARG